MFGVIDEVLREEIRVEVLDCVNFGRLSIKFNSFTYRRKILQPR